MNAKGIQQSKRLQNTQFMAPPGREEAFFFKSTLHFHQKVSQKHTKNENTKSGIGPTWHCADEAADKQFQGRTAPCSLDSGSGTAYC